MIRVRPLLRLAALAWRRTLLENSARLLATTVAVVLLADGAQRITSLRALDAWLVAALTWAVVLPVALTGGDPLRSVRLSLLPVPPVVLRRARVVAGAPMRLVFVLAFAPLGAVAARGVAPGGALLALVGWAIFVFLAGAALDEYWHRPRAALTRTVSAFAAAVGAWCLWSIRTPAAAATERGFALPVPALYPRGDDVSAWLSALALVGVSVAVSFVALRTPRRSKRRSTARSGRRPLFGSQSPRIRRVSNAAIFRLAGRPRVAHEVALLSRHFGPRICLALVVLLACAATYGRVPGLALVAVMPMVLLTANALGADLPLSGLLRHTLLPESFAAVRDRRLTVWALATAVAAMLGATLALTLPTPLTAGQPTGGVLAAPVLLMYAACLVPWFGRASWWWAQRYPQPSAQHLRDVGSPSAKTGPMGPAHLAVALLAGWALVALVASLLLAAVSEAAQVLVALTQAVPTVATASDAWSTVAWIGSVLVAAAAAIGLHLTVSSLPRHAYLARRLVPTESRA